MEIDASLENLSTLWQIPAYRHAIISVAGKSLGLGAIGLIALYFLCRIPPPRNKTAFIVRKALRRITPNAARGCLVVCSIMSLLTFVVIFSSLRPGQNGESTLKNFSKIRNYLTLGTELQHLDEGWFETKPTTNSNVSPLLMRYFLTVDLRYIARGAEKKTILAPPDLSSADFTALLRQSDFFSLKHSKNQLVPKLSARKIAADLDTNALNLKVAVFFSLDFLACWASVRERLPSTRCLSRFTNRVLEKNFVEV